MRHYGNIEVGAATHTGRVRSTNEDDYLIYVPQEPAELRGRGCLFVIADGMGGVTGGAEASRAAVRALATTFTGSNGLASGETAIVADTVDAERVDAAESMENRMRTGFQVANRQVLQLARESPGLRDMGTTLTAANLNGSRLVLGHVGDTRCLLLRDGRLARLTEDHAVRSPDNYLTRCVGAGQETVEADIGHHRLQVGDRIVLLTDGLWSVVDEEEIARILRTMDPQPAAEELVREANRNGGPDNSTVLVVHLNSVEVEPGGLLAVELPSEEVRQPSQLRPPTASLVAPRWPWLLLVLSLLLLVLAMAKMFFDVDLVQGLVRYFQGSGD